VKEFLCLFEQNFDCLPESFSLQMMQTFSIGLLKLGCKHITLRISEDSFSGVLVELVKLGELYVAKAI
jgi:hypothetical protein